MTLLIATVSAAVLVGFLSTLLGSLRPVLASRFDLPAEDAPHLGRRMSLAWIPLMPLTGYLVDAWGTHGILFAGSLALSLGVAWLAVARSWKVLAWSVLPLAWGGAALTLTALRLMPLVLDPLGEPDPTKAALRAFCIGFLFIAVAALLTQTLYPRLIQGVGYRNSLLVSALLCLTPAVLAALSEPASYPGALEHPEPGNTILDPRLWLIALLIFFWFPIEHSLDVWPKPFLGELGYNGRAVAVLLFGFWFWFLATRLAIGFLYLRGAEIWLIFVLALIPPMVLGNLVGAYAPSSGYFGFWVVGACYGPMLPAFLGHTFEVFPQRAFILGLLLSIDSLCYLLVQPAFISYLRGHTARQSMRVPLIFGLLLTGVLLVLALLRN